MTDRVNATKAGPQPSGSAVSTFLGAVASLILLAVPSARADDESWATSKLPFGTFLCIGGIISSLWGQPIVDAYLRSFGF